MRPTETVGGGGCHMFQLHDNERLRASLPSRLAMGPIVRAPCNRIVPPVRNAGVASAK